MCSGIVLSKIAIQTHINRNDLYTAVNDTVQGAFLPRVWKLITPYWRSEEKTTAWLLLVSVIALSLFSVMAAIAVAVGLPVATGRKVAAGLSMSAMV